MAPRLTYEQVRRASRSGWLDFEIVDPPPPYTLAVRAYFGAYASHFRILVEGLGFIDMPEHVDGARPELFPNVDALHARTDKWRGVEGVAEGRALLLWEGDWWDEARPENKFLVCARDFHFDAEPQWKQTEHPHDELQDVRERLVVGELTSETVGTFLRPAFYKALGDVAEKYLNEFERTMHCWNEPGRSRRIVRIIDAALAGTALSG